MNIFRLQRQVTELVRLELPWTGHWQWKVLLCVRDGGLATTRPMGCKHLRKSLACITIMLAAAFQQRELPWKRSSG